MTNDAVREARLRRELDRHGYVLQKSQADNLDDLTFGGYQIVDAQDNLLVAGWGNANRGYAFNIDDVEAWLAK